MYKTKLERSSLDDVSSIDSDYLVSTVGKCVFNERSNSVHSCYIGSALICGLAEVIERRPNDPIEYLANCLYKQVDNVHAEQQVTISMLTTSEHDVYMFVYDR
jgi:hypothetical protein